MLRKKKETASALKKEKCTTLTCREERQPQRPKAKCSKYFSVTMLLSSGAKKTEDKGRVSVSKRRTSFDIMFIFVYKVPLYLCFVRHYYKCDNLLDKATLVILKA